MQNRNVPAVIAGSCFLLAYALLFSFRAFDDNRLFSWQWLFAHTDASLVYLLLVAALAGAAFLARVPVPDGREPMLLAAFSFLAALPFWNQPETIVDASRYFTQAKHLSQYGVGFFVREWGREVFAWTDLPLVPLCYGLLFKLFGEGRLVIQVFTTLLFSLSTVLTFRIGRLLWGRETGLHAGMLLLGMPYLLTQVPLMLVDVPTMFLLVLSLWSLVESVERGGAFRCAAAAGAVVLFALSKYSSWPMLSLHVLAVPVYALSRDGDRKRRVMRGTVVLGAAGMVLAALLLLKLDVLLAQARLLREFQAPGLGRWGESPLSTFLFQVHPFITLSALAGAAIAVRKREWSFLVAGWLLLLVAVFDIQRIRYILPSFPMLALMAAYGLQAVREEQVRRFVVTGVVAASLAVGVSAYLPFARSMSAANLQHAGAVLDKLDAHQFEVITVQPDDPAVGSAVSVALLDLYTRKDLRFLPAPQKTATRAEDRERSPLRFTWEFPVPRYYGAKAAVGDGIPVVVVTGSAMDVPPAVAAGRLRGYRQTAALRSREGIFEYAPAVFLYERESSGRR